MVNSPTNLVTDRRFETFVFPSRRLDPSFPFFYRQTRVGFESLFEQRFYTFRFLSSHTRESQFHARKAVRADLTFGPAYGFNFLPFPGADPGTVARLCGAYPLTV